MKVLSLFDGISCARVALERAGIPVETYWRAEIDKHANAVSQARWPDAISLGDVRTVHPEDWEVDLLIGGSPCQDLSIAKKGRKGLEGERSGLFWEYVRIWQEARPKWFILENVASMPKEAKDLISKTLGVEPVMIDAALVGAQSRKRLFWTNLPVVGLPEDRGILLKDILLPEVDERLYTKATFTATPQKQTHLHSTKKLGYTKGIDHQANRVYDDEGKAPALNTLSANGLVKLGHLGEKETQSNRVYSPEGKSQTLTSPKTGGVSGSHTGFYTMKVGYVGSDPEGKSTTFGTTGAGLVQLGHLGNTNSQGNRVYAPEGKSVSLQANAGGGGAKTGLYATPRIRKLDPVECERLQGLPDGYTEGIANTQRYKCLGNAFHVDVIAWIVSFAKNVETK